MALFFISMQNHKTLGQNNNPWLIWAVACGISTPFLVHLFPKVMVVVISLGLASLVAYLIGAWYIRRGKFEKRVLMVLFWSNLVAWIIPDLGFLVGALTTLINSENQGKDRRKYMILGYDCVTLSVIHFSLKLAHIIKW